MSVDWGIYIRGWLIDTGFESRNDSTVWHISICTSIIMLIRLSISRLVRRWHIDIYLYSSTLPNLTLVVKLQVTWLILPVVICLFQRLSHASLSISFYTAKLRIAHYNSYNLHEDHYQMDIHGNSGANTCKNTWLLGKVAFISLGTIRVAILVFGDHNDRADRFTRQFVRVSDLSAPVGRVLAYRGCDG